MRAENKPEQKAVILLSGGLDSVTVLALAKQQGYRCYALSFDYGQRHNAELDAARRIAQHYQVLEHKVIRLDLGNIGGSALTDASIAVPTSPQSGIPVTYVPARNTVFLAYALGWYCRPAMYSLVSMPSIIRAIPIVAPNSSRLFK